MPSCTSGCSNQKRFKNRDAKNRLKTICLIVHVCTK